MAFHEYRALLADVRRAPTWRQKLAHAYHGPGWQPQAAAITPAPAAEHAVLAPEQA